MSLLPIILAGGTGSRLWPLSRELYPKQIINLTGKLSLLQTTFTRLEGLDNLLDPIVVVGEEHRFMTKRQLEELEIFPNYKLILEPEGKNTAPAICAAAIYAMKNGFEDATLLVLPADHLVSKVESFHEAVHDAAGLAAIGKLVTFGITAKRAETGYGYIKAGKGNTLECFVEKPYHEQAQSYIEKGNYFWNSGMFAFTAEKLLGEMKTYAPDIVAKMSEAVETGCEDGNFFRLGRESMSACVADSIDYALMEKTENGALVQADIGWSDIGSWKALWEASAKDGYGNVTNGDVMLEDVRNSYVRADHSLVTAIGLEDTMVVETADAVLIAPMDRSQDVKKIVTRLRENKRGEFLNHRTVHRPWGSYTTLELQNRFQIKRITVNPGAKLSLQMHYHRHEHWIVVSGTAKIMNGKETILLKEDESTYISAGKQHRLENPGVIPLELIEVQIGSYLGEDDIVRFEDIYGRKN